MKTLGTIGAITVAGFLTLSPGPVRASDEADGGSTTEASDALSQGAQQEVERLRQLKQQDPEAYQKAVSQKKQALRERMAHLKETDPEAFERMKHHLQEQQRHRLARLKENDPEKFHEVMQRRQEAQERWKNATPEQRKEWKQQHPKRDRDNNPPGPRDGKGTNWENPPGPRGGPGVGPDHENRGVRDHGQGEGRGGVGMGGERRAPGAGPKGGR